jgi:hypothetical protein
MTKWKIWVGLLVLFVSGLLIGSVATRMYVRHQVKGIFARERPAIRNLFLGRLTGELDLTSEQRQAIEQIANRAAEKFYDLHKKHRGEVEAVLDRSAREMKKHLSPAQQEQFDAFRKKMKERHKRWRGRRHGPDHHPRPPPMRGPPPPPP